MKKFLILIFTTLLLISFNLYSADSSSDKNKEDKKEEKKFIGQPGVEFEQDFQADTTGNKLLVNYGLSEVYMKSRAKAQLAFSFNFDKKKPLNSTEGSFYTINPWVQDAVELPFFATAGSSNTTTPNVKNNFYAGLDNTFNIDKVMNIGLTFEFRLGSCLGANPVTGTPDGMEVRLSPVVNLSGSYDLGLSWNISQYFEFYFFPYISDLNNAGSTNLSSKNLQFTEFEGNYNLSYEFLHLAKIEKIKMSLYGEMYLRARALNEGYYIKNYFPAGHQIQNLDPAVGLTFDIYGFTPFVLYFTHAFGNSKDNRLTGSWVGIKAGLGYTKDWFSFGFTYYGMINSDPTTNYFDNGNKAIGANGKWMNHFESFVLFKIGG